MKTKRFFWIAAVLGLLLTAACGSGRWIENAAGGDAPWLNYRSLNDYIETIAPGFFEGKAARGVNTFNNSSDPLLLLDGQAVSSFFDVSLEDVQSVEVIVDSRVAAYGVRGASGVALVTTKGAHVIPNRHIDK